MSRFLNLPIRTQLLLLAILLTLPTLGIIVYSGLSQRSESVTHAYAESQELADNIAAGLENLLHNTEQIAMLLADLPEVKNRDAEKASQILARLKKNNPGYNTIMVVDENGLIWGASQEARGYSVAEREYFQKVRATLGFSSGGYVISLKSKTPTIHVAYPLVEQGQFRGAIVIGFALDALRSIMGRSQLGKGANYVITDSRGIIISRGRPIGQVVGKPILATELQRMAKGPDRMTFEFRRFDGDPRITTYRKLYLDSEKAPFMYIRAGISTKEALAEADRSLLINIVCLFLFAFFAFSVVLLIGKRSIADRISLLKRASQRLASGDLNTKVSDQVTGGELGSLGRTFDDMAQQLAAREQALRESERNYHDIFDSVRDGLFVQDREKGRVVDVNKSAETMFGYSREEMLNMAIVELSAGDPPYSAEEAKDWLRKVVNEGPQEFIWSCRRKNGSLFWAEIAGSAKSIAGRERILAIVRDITERRELERMKEEMLSVVSHEMRTPLTAMLGFMQFVEENPVTEAQIRDYLAIMHREADRLNRTINNFLDMQRMKTMSRSFNQEPLQIGELVEEATEIFDSPSSRHRLHVELPASLPAITGDRTLLHQMLNNLISNAIKYSAEGSRIMVGAKADGKTITLWVRDEGVGIPPDSLEKVFDMFYRVENGAMRKTGTGLGLALVKEIVIAHAGQIWVESTLGAGSIFYVALPAVADGPACVSLDETSSC